MKTKAIFKRILLITIVSFVIYTTIDVINYANNPANSAPWEVCLLVDLFYLFLILSLEILIYLIINRPIYYLAYGSNISVELIKEHCKTAKLIGIGKLYDYKLNFKSVDNIRSFATIEKEEGNSLPVVLYKISRSDLKELDKYEEIEDYLYYKKRVKVVINKKIYFPITYIMNDNSKEQIPNNDYLEKLYKGYKEFEFNPGYILDSLYKIDKKIS